jgi:Spy/CpxP family protein refolding chaperone
MTIIHQMRPLRLVCLAAAAFLALSWLSAKTVLAQAKTSDAAPHQHPDTAKDGDKSQADQIRELQAKVSKLEAALKQTHPGAAASDSGMSGMPMGGTQKPQMGPMGGGTMGAMGNQQGAKGGQMGMGMMDMDMKGGMAAGGGGMGIMETETESMEMMGMMGMGSMGGSNAKGNAGMAKMQRFSALPGFPGASHMYHIGSTGFFLDHPEHITPSPKQQANLNRLKEKALMEKSSAQRNIDEAEQELWALTGADQPDAAKIEAKVREIEKLKADQRLAFIRSVGEAAKILTDEQREALLLGSGKADAADPHAGHKPDTSHADKPQP